MSRTRSTTPPAPRSGNWPPPDQQLDGPLQAARPDQRALVLAGGGAAGNAWELGLVAGLCDAGVDVTEADLVIGTSAGSTVAAQITSGVRPADLYTAVLAEVPAGRPALGAGRSPAPSGADYLAWSDALIGAAADAADMRRRMGAA